MPPFLSTLFGGDPSSASHESDLSSGVEASPDAQVTVEGEHADGSGTSHSYSEHAEAGAHVSTSAILDGSSEGD